MAVAAADAVAGRNGKGKQGEDDADNILNSDFEESAETTWRRHMQTGRAGHDSPSTVPAFKGDSASASIGSTPALVEALTASSTSSSSLPIACSRNEPVMDAVWAASREPASPKAESSSCPVAQDDDVGAERKSLLKDETDTTDTLVGPERAEEEVCPHEERSRDEACSSCGAAQSVAWRRSRRNSLLVCNACYLVERLEDSQTFGGESPNEEPEPPVTRSMAQSVPRSQAANDLVTIVKTASHAAAKAAATAAALGGAAGVVEQRCRDRAQSIQVAVEECEEDRHMRLRQGADSDQEDEALQTFWTPRLKHAFLGMKPEMEELVEVVQEACAAAQNSIAAAQRCREYAMEALKVAEEVTGESYHAETEEKLIKRREYVMRTTNQLPAKTRAPPRLTHPAGSRPSSHAPSSRHQAASSSAYPSNGASRRRSNEGRSRNHNGRVHKKQSAGPSRGGGVSYARRDSTSTEQLVSMFPEFGREKVIIVLRLYQWDAKSAEKELHHQRKKWNERKRIAEETGEPIPKRIKTRRLKPMNVNDAAEYHDWSDDEDEDMVAAEEKPVSQEEERTAADEQHDALEERQAASDDRLAAPPEDRQVAQDQRQAAEQERQDALDEEGLDAEDTGHISQEERPVLPGEDAAFDEGPAS